VKAVVITLRPPARACTCCGVHVRSCCVIVGIAAVCRSARGVRTIQYGLEPSSEGMCERCVPLLVARAADPDHSPGAVFSVLRRLLTRRSSLFSCSFLIRVQRDFTRRTSRSRLLAAVTLP